MANMMLDGGRKWQPHRNGTPSYFEAELTWLRLCHASCYAWGNWRNALWCYCWSYGSGLEGFKRKEEEAFLVGDGIKPKGLLNQAMASAGDDTRSMEKFQMLTTAQSGKWVLMMRLFQTLIDVIDSFDVGFQGASWLMNKSTLTLCVKFAIMTGIWFIKAQPLIGPQIFTDTAIYPPFLPTGAGKIALGLVIESGLHIKDFPVFMWICQTNRHQYGRSLYAKASCDHSWQYPIC